MAMDTPARIAILGSGPIGLEAALYARYLGYDVDLYERGEVAANVASWGHVQLGTPFKDLRSPLGLAALQAQDESWRPPADDALLTGAEYRERYLLPLAQSDLLSDQIQTGYTVVGLGREGVHKGDYLHDERRGEFPFRILLRTQDGQERFANADVVFDATGVFGNRVWSGRGGLPAIGEIAAAANVEYGLPDVLDRERSRYAGRQTLVIGEGYPAALTVSALAELGHQVPGTWVTWVTARNSPPTVDDASSARAEVMAGAARWAQGDADHVQYHGGTFVESLHWRSTLQKFVVRLAGQFNGEVEADQVVANVGWQPDLTLASELQVAFCPATGAPLGFAEQLLARRDASAPLEFTPESLLNDEPHFYVLGAKSFGRREGFRVADGLRQIQRLFTIIGERANLDLYVGK